MTNDVVDGEAVAANPHTGEVKRALAEPNTILRTLVGSRVHGLGVNDQDDRDEMGICVEPWQHFFGLRPRFEQWQFRTQPTGHRSGPGDLDLVIYSLAKWASLALGGNPSVLLPLFTPETALIVATEHGRELRAMRSAFVGDNIFVQYLGYMRAQRMRMTGERTRKVVRPELVERYGYDTKFAGHMLRLGYQGIELATTGAMSLPMVEAERVRIIDVRTGKVPMAEVIDEALGLEAKIDALSKSSPLPPPDRERVERFVIDCYMERHPYQ